MYEFIYSQVHTSYSMAICYAMVRTENNANACLVKTCKQICKQANKQTGKHQSGAILKTQRETNQIKPKKIHST